MVDLITVAIKMSVYKKKYKCFITLYSINQSDKEVCLAGNGTLTWSSIFIFTEENISLNCGLVDQGGQR